MLFTFFPAYMLSTLNRKKTRVMLYFHILKAFFLNRIDMCVLISWLIAFFLGDDFHLISKKLNKNKINFFSLIYVQYINRKMMITQLLYWRIDLFIP